MTQQQIQKFNQQLINDGEVITIVDYVKKLNTKFFHIDLSFIDDFIELVNNDECCISQELLQKYDIYKFTGGSCDIKKLVDQNRGIEGVDYMVRINSDRDAYTHKIIYFFNPSLFKKV